MQTKPLSRLMIDQGSKRPGHFQSRWISNICFALIWYLVKVLRRYLNGLKQIRAPSKANRHVICVNILYDCEVSVIRTNVWNNQ